MNKFVFCKLKENFQKDENLKTHFDVQPEDIHLYIKDLKGEIWKFDPANRISDLIQHNIWSRKVISEDQDEKRVITSKLKPRDLEKIFFAV